jgi:hypothetical protein
LTLAPWAGWSADFVGIFSVCFIGISMPFMWSWPSCAAGARPDNKNHRNHDRQI